MDYDSEIPPEYRFGEWFLPGSDEHDRRWFQRDQLSIDCWITSGAKRLANQRLINWFKNISKVLEAHSYLSLHRWSSSHLRRVGEVSSVTFITFSPEIEPANEMKPLSNTCAQPTHTPNRSIQHHSSAPSFNHTANTSGYDSGGLCDSGFEFLPAASTPRLR